MLADYDASMSLGDVLAVLLFTHNKSSRGLYKKDVFIDGIYVDSMDSAECWSWLRKTGRIG